jgi:hypothetical protein
MAGLFFGFVIAVVFFNMMGAYSENIINNK